MIKRRSFLAMLGLAPMAAVTKAVPEPLAAPVAPAIETAAESVVMANVRMPIKIGLTQEQVSFCEAAGIDINDYAKNLLELKKSGKIEGPVNVDDELLKGITNKPEFSKPKTIRDLRHEENLRKPWVLPNFIKLKPEPEKRIEPTITHNMGDKPSYMKEIDPNVWSNL